MNFEKNDQAIGMAVDFSNPEDRKVLSSIFVQAAINARQGDLALFYTLGKSSIQQCASLERVITGFYVANAATFDEVDTWSKEVVTWNITEARFNSQLGEKQFRELMFQLVPKETIKTLMSETGLEESEVDRLLNIDVSAHEDFSVN